MTPTFTWIDHSEQQRRRVLDVLDLFREQTTVDELGVGTIRDAFADMLFPGTSAPQTRARYFLFVPWIYLQFERRRVPSAEIAKKLHRVESELIERLLEVGETDGVIGRVARASLQRRPSSIYWSGLCRLGVCLFQGSQSTYHRSLDRFYQRQQGLVRTDDGDTVAGVRANWHPDLPEAPEDFPSTATLALRRGDAEYLRDRIAISAPTSLFARLVSGATIEQSEFPWEHRDCETFGETIGRQLVHARNFSEVMHGAALLYNLVLSELTGNGEWQDEYRGLLAEWESSIDERKDEFRRWDRTDFWRCARQDGARISLSTQAFVERWWHLALDGSVSSRLTDRRDARELITHRERALKGPLARVDSARARELWGGAAGTGRLTYRWLNARRIVADILDALER